MHIAFTSAYCLYSKTRSFYMRNVSHTSHHNIPCSQTTHCSYADDNKRRFFLLYFKISWSSWWWRWVIHSILKLCVSKSLYQDGKLFALEIKTQSAKLCLFPLPLLYTAIYRELNGMLFVLVFLSSGLRNIFCLSFFPPRARAYMFSPSVVCKRMVQCL